MNDISNTLAIKRWCRFRTQPSLWADFKRAKYCNRVHPVSKAWTSGNSQACKSLIKAREDTEINIPWIINDGCCSMWWNNCTEKGALAVLYPDKIDNIKANVSDYIGNDIIDMYIQYIEVRAGGVTYNKSYQANIGMPYFEALHICKCRTPLCWVSGIWRSFMRCSQIT